MSPVAKPTDDPSVGGTPLDFSALLGASTAELEALLRLDTGPLAQAASSWGSLAQDLQEQISGQSAQGATVASTSVVSLDDAVASLKDWQGAAADEFRAKAERVREFGLGLVKRFQLNADVASGQYTPGNGTAFDDTLSRIQFVLDSAGKTFDDGHHGPGTTTTSDGTNQENYQPTSVYAWRGKVAQNLWDMVNRK